MSGHFERHSVIFPVAVITDNRRIAKLSRNDIQRSFAVCTETGGIHQVIRQYEPAYMFHTPWCHGVYDGAMDIAQTQITPAPPELILFVNGHIAHARPFFRLQRILASYDHFSQRDRVQCRIEIQFFRVYEMVDFFRLHLHRLKRCDT